MDRLTFDVWQRQGTSVVFDAELLAPVLQAGSLVSLRQALGWASGAAALPEDVSTVLVGGLDTLLRVLGAQDGARFLRQRVHPLVLRFQQRRDHQALVFGFNAAPQEFLVNHQDRVLFRVHGGDVPLSETLWAPTAVVDALYRDDADAVPRGYYVRRVS